MWERIQVLPPPCPGPYPGPGHQPPTHEVVGSIYPDSRKFLTDRTSSDRLSQDVLSPQIQVSCQLKNLGADVDFASAVVILPSQSHVTMRKCPRLVRARTGMFGNERFADCSGGYLGSCLRINVRCRQAIPEDASTIWEAGLVVWAKGRTSSINLPLDTGG